MEAFDTWRYCQRALLVLRNKSKLDELRENANPYNSNYLRLKDFTIVTNVLNFTQDMGYHNKDHIKTTTSLMLTTRHKT
jgi:hypothetical protein